MAKLPDAPEEYNPSRFREILTEIESQIEEAEMPISDDYAVENMGVRRTTFDFGTATDAEVRETLATLITDLKRRGWLA